MVMAQTVLIVDDEPMVTRGCRRILSEAGYQVDTAATGQEGLNRAVEGRFDVVMTDLKLPDLDGMELVRRLRNCRPDQAIVILTGYGSVSSAVEAVKLGVSNYLEKPFTPEQIVQAVEQAVVTRGDDRPAPIEKETVLEVLRQAQKDPQFGRRLLEEGSRILAGVSLRAATQAAIVSGDIAWIEKQFGPLGPGERQWLLQRLQAERW